MSSMFSKLKQRSHSAFVLGLLFTCISKSTVYALDNGFIRPPMGWSGLYGAPFSSINETKVEIAASSLASSGLLDAGYEYIVLDDWYASRDGQAGKIKGVPDKFPSGIPALSDKVHSHGVKFGIYSSASMRTCGNFSGSLFNEVNDAYTFANEWKVDYVKYDSCIYNGGVASRARYEAMSRALNATGRSIFFSVEGWSPEDGNWGPELADMWRVGNDIWPTWDRPSPGSILTNLYQCNVAAKFHKVGGGFNDPDMLQPPGDTLKSVLKPGLSSIEAASQFLLWAIMKSPLILGVQFDQLADLKNLDPSYYNLITNKEVIALNQDLSPQASLVAQYPSTAQQNSGRSFDGSIPIEITLQTCDISRPDQRFEPFENTKNVIKHVGSNLCVHESNAGQILARPCEANSTQFQPLTFNEQISIAKSAASQKCLQPDTFDDVNNFGNLTTSACIYDGPLPPPLLNEPNNFEASFGSQSFVWGPSTHQVVSAGHGGNCLTLGIPNIKGRFNESLEHEVWIGPLTPTANPTAQRIAVLLFNKSPDTDTVVAPADLLAQWGITSTSTGTQRNLVTHTESPLSAHSGLSATLPGHGTALYVLTISDNHMR